MAKPNSRRAHVSGQSVEREEHGLYRTAEYRAYHHMLDRCYNPKNKTFHHYGGRGIFVCSEWRASFARFYADMGQKPTPKHELDRQDNSLGYTPENCRWATRREQCQNRRGLHLVTFGDITASLTQMARAFGLNRHTVRIRIARGWSVERAFKERPRLRPTTVS